MRMETKQTICAETENRRSFLKETGKKALWAAPVVTVLMTASSQRAVPQTSYKLPKKVAIPAP